MKTERIYGNAPQNLGFINIQPEEMMFWLYCPIKTPSDEFFTLPHNLKQYEPLVLRVMEDCLQNRWWHPSYVYITAKTLYTNPENPGNRPGWHSDGFLTTDINYIWYDSKPTVFWVGEHVSFTKDHEKSLQEMEDLCENSEENQITYPNKSLLRLDETVLHKVSTSEVGAVRTFVKVSVSSEKYNLKGNSKNYLLPTDWEYEDRKPVRNCPQGS